MNQIILLGLSFKDYTATMWIMLILGSLAIPAGIVVPIVIFFTRTKDLYVTGKVLRMKDIPITESIPEPDQYSFEPFGSVQQKVVTTHKYSLLVETGWGARIWVRIKESEMYKKISEDYMHKKEIICLSCKKFLWNKGVTGVEIM